MRKRYLARSAPGIRPQTVSNARRADRQAASMSAGPAKAISASFRPFAGLMDAKYFPVLGATNFPLIKRS